MNSEEQSHMPNGGESSPRPYNLLCLAAFFWKAVTTSMGQGNGSMGKLSKYVLSTTAQGK